MSATTMKVCTVCNVDCADRPRVKDEFGRYTCRACLDKHTPAAAPSLEDEGFDLRAAAMMEARTQAMDLPEAQSCPRCHGFFPGEQRLCMRCGYDRKRGAKVVTRVEKVKEVKPERARHPIDVTWIVIGFGLLTVGCAASVFVSPVMALPAIGLLLLLGFGLYVTMIVCQFRDGETVYAVCSLVGLFVGFTSVASLFWLFAVNDRGWLKGLWACLVLSYIILFMAAMSMAGGFEGILNGNGVQ